MTENTLLAVISQAVKSVKRVRNTLLVSVFGSVFVFICAYNTFSWGWMNSGQKFNSVLHEWCIQKSDLPIGTFPTTSNTELKTLYNKFQEDFQSNPRMCEDFIMIAPSIGEKNYLSRKFINIPFTEVVFDVNDLGMFSGVFFSLVMLVLWYNLGLKYANLFTALKTIEDIEMNGNKRTYFNLLSMSQIISIPDDDNSSHDSNFLVFIPYLLFSFPFFTCLTIFINEVV